MSTPTKLAMAFNGKDISAQDIQSTVFDGSTWTNPSTDHRSGTSFMPAMAVYRDKIYMVWKGIDHPDPTVTPNDQNIFYSSSSDGLNWTDQKRIGGGGTTGGISLAVLNDKLYMAWKGRIDNGVNDHRMFYCFFDGTNWSEQQDIPNVRSCQGPGMASTGDRLIIAFTGEDAHSQDIQYATFDGNSWSGPNTDGAKGTSFIPALAQYNGKVYMAWKGVNQPAPLNTIDNHIYFSYYNGSGWESQTPLDFTTSGGLSLAALNGKLYMAWKGEKDDQNIYYSSFDGTSWSPKTKVNNAITAVGPGMCAF